MPRALRRYPCSYTYLVIWNLGIRCRLALSCKPLNPLELHRRQVRTAPAGARTEMAATLSFRNGFARSFFVGQIILRGFQLFLIFVILCAFSLFLVRDRFYLHLWVIWEGREHILLPWSSVRCMCWYDTKESPHIFQDFRERIRAIGILSATKSCPVQTHPEVAVAGLREGASTHP